jgi:hypothetical protein
MWIFNAIANAVGNNFIGTPNYLFGLLFNRVQADGGVTEAQQCTINELTDLQNDNLLSSASLLVTPNAYKASKLYSIIPTNGNGDLTFTRSTTATRTNSSGILESVALNIPRLEYPSGGCPSILLEPQRTNIIARSEEFNTWLLYQFSSIATNTATAPNGTLTADTLISGVSVGRQEVYKSPNSAFVNGTSYSVSVYAKTNGKTWLYLGTDANQSVYFNVVNGTVGNASSGFTGSIVSVGNGWYRCIINFVFGTGATVNQIIIGNATTNGTPSDSGNGVLGNYIWGCQVEAGAYATSYIPTTSASVTRNADVASKTGITSLIGQTEGTLFAEIEVSKLIGAASRYIFHISDGTANNRVYMAFSGASSNVLRGRIFNGGTLQCSIDTSAITTIGTYKLALAYKNNDIVFYVNGVQIGVDTSATIPTCSRVDLGQNYANTSQLSDGIKASVLWKTRLTNAELAQLTTI